MSKCRGKHVCGRICAKSVRLVLGRYSQHLISRGYSTRTREVYVQAVEYFGRWLGRRRVGWPQVQQFLDRGLPTCRCPGVMREAFWAAAARRHAVARLLICRGTPPE